MKTNTFIILAGLCAITVVGCGPNTGLLIKPVPVNQELEETVISTDPGWFVSDRIVVLDVDGLLFNQRETGLFGSGENPVAMFAEKLDKALADDRVRAVVLRINSPGGGVTASDIMYQRLGEFRRKKKAPVIACIEDVGASGGYYLACGADKIMAHPTSVTGSIGVIVQTISLAGTMQKIGVDAKAIVSGPYKDMASPLKPLDDKDLRILQGIVDEFYGRFVEVVATGRGGALGQEKAKLLADGRVYTGQQALKEGLVDQLGTVDDAIRLAKQTAGGGKFKVVMYHRPMGYRANAYSSLPGPGQINLLNITVPNLLSTGQPQFLYLWTGRGGAGGSGL